MNHELTNPKRDWLTNHSLKYRVRDAGQCFFSGSMNSFVIENLWGLTLPFWEVLNTPVHLTQQPPSHHPLALPFLKCIARSRCHLNACRFFLCTFLTLIHRDFRVHSTAPRLSPSSNIQRKAVILPGWHLHCSGCLSWGETPPLCQVWYLDPRPWTLNPSARVILTTTTTTITTTKSHYLSPLLLLSITTSTITITNTNTTGKNRNWERGKWGLRGGTMGTEGWLIGVQGRLIRVIWG